MKIHSDSLTAQDLHDATPEGVSIVEIHTAGSRTRRHAWNVFLTGSNRRQSAHWNEAMQAYPRAATYAEWGWWMVALFAIDPDAVIGPYKGEGDFHDKTRCAFLDDTVPHWNPNWMGMGA